VDSGNIAWMLASTALVLFMTPGLAFFYGGMDRSRNVLNMLMMNFYCLLVIPLLWAAVGYSLSFSVTDHGIVGGFGLAMMRGINLTQESAPAALVKMIFLATFAAITPALISGAVAGRMKFSAWAIFVPVWSLLVYCPVTYWVAADNGWMKQMGALDFAGGTSIHVNAGIAALAAVLVLGKRKGWPREGAPPHSMPLVMLGTGILWFGWFGFNAGSQLGADGVTVQVFINTFLAASAAGLSWSVVERLRDGHFTNLGVASGIVAGLVAITPACGFVSTGSAMAIGAIAGVACCYAVLLKNRFLYDDALDVVGVHFVGGLVGSILIGLFSHPQFFGYPQGQGLGADGLLQVTPGLFFGGGLNLLGYQLVANGAAVLYSFIASFAIMKILDAVMGVRVSADDEQEGLDLTQHAETAYHSAERGLGRGI